MKDTRTTTTLLLCALAAMLLLPTAAKAQELPELTDSTAILRIDDVDESDHPVITATVTVPRALVGYELGAESFSVTEGGAILPVTVTQLPNDALQVVLVLDASGSMAGSPLAAAKEAALSFVAAMPPGVEIAVVAFGNESVALSGFSTDPEDAVAALDRLTTQGETALYDALVAASVLFPEAEDARRRVVLLSDGGDTVSAASLEQAIVGLLGSGAGFTAVELVSPEQDSAALERLAAAVDGRVVGADDPAALDAIFQTIASDLVNQYKITYEAEAFGFTEVTIGVAAAGVAAATNQAVRYPPAPTPATVPAPSPTPVPTPAIADVPEPVAAQPTARIVVPGPLSDPTNLAIGGALIFLALVLGSQSFRVSQRTVAAVVKRAARKRAHKTGALSGIASRATMLAERTLERSGDRGVGRLLEQAGVRLRTGEFVVLAGSVAMTLLVVATLAFSILVGLALGLATALGFRYSLSWRASRRRRAFADQLGDVLQLISGSIKAGYGLLQALEAAASESLPPTSEELQRLLIETQLGRNLPEALRAMAERVDSEDFRWVVEAIEIQREVGGDLAEILETVAATIRDRAGIRRRIHALSAEGRLSAYILTGLPFVVGAAISFTNPGYMSELTGSVAGRFMIGGGIGLMIVGAAWMRRIVRLVF